MLDGLERVGGTAAGNYLRLAPGVVIAVPHTGYVQSEDAAKASLAELDRIARADGRRQVVVVFVDRVAGQSASARRVWATPREHETRCGQALVCGTLLARAIGSFFLGLTKAPIPTRMFATLDAAKAWSVDIAEHSREPVV